MKNKHQRRRNSLSLGWEMHGISVQQPLDLVLMCVDIAVHPLTLSSL